MIVPLFVVGLLVLLWVRVRDARLAGATDAVVDPTTWAPTAVVVTPVRARAVAALAVAEARRIVTHPVLVVGAVLGTLLVGVNLFDDDPYARYAELTGGGAISLYVPPLTFVAAGLCASRPRRARAGELLDATPASPFDRTLAQCLAALGPALVAFGAILAAWALFTVVEPPLPAAPPVWELLTMPLALLGAGTLGVMVSRWLPFRGAPLVVLVALVFASVWVAERAPLLITLVDYLEWENDVVVGLASVPTAAHGLYIIGLSAMAAIGALLVHRQHVRVLLALGALATTGTIVAALAAT